MQIAPQLDAADSDHSDIKAVAESKNQFDVLTGLTFLPLAVICWHHGRDFWVPMTGLFEQQVAFKHFVTLFFVLSGFILAYRHNHIKNLGSALSFYIDRAAWLWPVHLFCLFFLLFLVPEVFQIKGEWTPPFLCNLFMAQTWVPIAKYYFSFNAPSWMFATLASLNLLFPIVLIGCRRSKAAVLTVSAVIALVLVCLTASLKLPVDNFSGPSIQGMLYVNPLARLLELATGVAVALTYLRFSDRVKLSLLSATGLEALTLGLVAYVNIQSRGWQAQLNPLITEAGAFWVHHSFVEMLPLALFLCVLSTGKGLVARFFASKPMVFLGGFSFSFFMIHGVLIAYLNVNFRPEGALLSAFYFFSGLMVAGHIMQTLFVGPIRRQLSYYGNKLLQAKIKNFDIPKTQAHSNNRWRIPNWRWLVLEVPACFLLMYLAHPTIQPISLAAADKFCNGLTVRNIDFEPFLECRGAVAKAESDRVTLKTVWLAKKSESVDFYVVARLLDEKNAVLGFSRYAMDGRHQQVSPNQLWLDTTEIRYGSGQRPAKVAIKVTRGKRKTLTPRKTTTEAQIEQSELFIDVKDIREGSPQ